MKILGTHQSQPESDDFVRGPRVDKAGAGYIPDGATCRRAWKVLERVATVVKMDLGRSCALSNSANRATGEPTASELAASRPPLSVFRVSF